MVQVARRCGAVTSRCHLAQCQCEQIDLMNRSQVDKRFRPLCEPGFPGGGGGPPRPLRKPPPPSASSGGPYWDQAWSPCSPSTNASPAWHKTFPARITLNALPVGTCSLQEAATRRPAVRPDVPGAQSACIGALGHRPSLALLLGLVLRLWQCRLRGLELRRLFWKAGQGSLCRVGVVRPSRQMDETVRWHTLLLEAFFAAAADAGSPDLAVRLC